jgi:hypothetical protein
MKTQIKSAKMVITMLLVTAFTFTGFGQSDGPPGNDSMQLIDDITSITKGPDQKKNCIELKISPNPIRNSATIEFTIEKATEMQIAVYNQKGVMVMDVVKQRFDKGKNTVTFTPSHLPTGTYYVCVFCGKKRGLQRCMII